jgi:hypothetical protein
VTNSLHKPRLRIPPQSLAAVDLFLGLPLSVLEIVASAARARRAQSGTQIFNQGDEAFALTRSWKEACVSPNPAATAPKWSSASSAQASYSV